MTIAVGMPGPGTHQSCLVGEHPSMATLRLLIQRAARLDAPVTVEGATGTGKELVVAELYRHTGLGGRLVPTNAAALPESLAEAELFGAMKGAFTGADRTREGRVHHARGGMLFLDEAADLSHALQAKLLRALDSGEVQRLGESGASRVEFRLVVAIKVAAETLVRSGLWRDDFKYRVATLRLRIPALSERLSDIPVLVRHFAPRLGLPPIEPAALRTLCAYDWPGNVRQLKQVLQRAQFLSDDQVLSAGHVEAAIAQEQEDVSAGTCRPSAGELSIILGRVNGRVTGVAKALGITRATAYRWLTEAGVPYGRSWAESAPIQQAP